MSKIHCHICFSMDVEEEYVCEHCEEHYCLDCSAQFTIHSQIDYCCCYMCSDQYPIRRKDKAEIRENKVNLLLEDDESD